VKRFTTAVVAALIVVGGFVADRPAGADQIADKRAEAARIAAALDQKAQAAEVLAERYNAARIKADDAASAVTTAAKALSVTDAQMKKSEAALRETAVQAYVQGGFLPLNDAPPNPHDALDMSVRRQYLTVVASRQSDALSSLRAARADLASKQSQLDAANQSSRQAVAAAEGERKAAAAAVADQQALLSKVKGELGTLVAAEQARKAAEEAKRVQAALAAKAAASKSTSAKPAPSSPTNSGAAKPLLNTSTGTAPSNPPPPPNSMAATAVAEAKRQLGKAYEWAGAGPDTFDCSGLTMWAWAHAGKTLSHNAAAQYNETARVPIADLQPGDLVFFGSDLHHVGIYVGSGQMIDAPQTGEVVRYDSIYRSDLVQSGGRVY
jgi:peptidoglycan DL-endopeptidase CwlO